MSIYIYRRHRLIEPYVNCVTLSGSAVVFVFVYIFLFASESGVCLHVDGRRVSRGHIVTGGRAGSLCETGTELIGIISSIFRRILGATRSLHLYLK